MFAIDDATAVAVMPTPEAAGTPGYFTEGNPALGQAATYVRASWLNAFQQELLNVLAGAGMPIKVYNTPTVRVEANTSVTLATPLVHCTQDLTVDGLLTTLNFTMLGGGTANWGAGGGGTMNYNNMTVTYTNSTITSNGHIIDHRETHSGVTTGGGVSGPSV